MRGWSRMAGPSLTGSTAAKSTMPRRPWLGQQGGPSGAASLSLPRNLLLSRRSCRNRPVLALRSMGLEPRECARQRPLHAKTEPEGAKTGGGEGMPVVVSAREMIRCAIPTALFQWRAMDAKAVRNAIKDQPTPVDIAFRTGLHSDQTCYAARTRIPTV